ncbi:hypothetical protein HPB48_014491 [Haemaphysalis longicornis]|uniref:EB domain-containing protein n=1 Tax=Haemaphysalis longicornis TaxID=44386 RepID=A0A9J6GKK6_HAELO|nr:hypothetical protein HPB48_014491 [Haemaphysalis longicornis]
MHIRDFSISPRVRALRVLRSASDTSLALSAAKSLYESCVSSAECSANNPNVQCIDFLCYCPLPFVLTEDHRCLPRESINS